MAPSLSCSACASSRAMVSFPAPGGQGQMTRICLPFGHESWACTAGAANTPTPPAMATIINSRLRITILPVWDRPFGDRSHCVVLDRGTDAAAFRLVVGDPD